jgi:hypothetical protein
LISSKFVRPVRPADLHGCHPTFQKDTCVMAPCSGRQKTQRTHVAMIPASLVGFHSIRAPPNAVMDEAAFRLTLRPDRSSRGCRTEYAYDHQSQVGPGQDPRRGFKAGMARRRHEARSDEGFRVRTVREHYDVLQRSCAAQAGRAVEQVGTMRHVRDLELSDCRILRRD